MIIEDDEDIRECLAAYVEARGNTAITAENGITALEILQKLENPPCVIFLDLMMPVMDGWQFLSERLKKGLALNTPVVVISAIGSQQSFSGLITFLHKPIDLDNLDEHCDKFCPKPMSWNETKSTEVEPK